MYTKKRKTSYLRLDYPRHEDEEDEDEWEREAYSFSSPQQKKPSPPNPYAIQVDIMNNQHAILNHTQHNLANQLQQLQHELQQLEQEESTNSSRLRQECIASIDDTVSLVHATVHSEKADDERFQTDTIEQIINDWKRLLESHKQDKHQSQLPFLAHAHRSTEFDLIDLNSQINGYEARIQVLNRERIRLNSLPQIIPILTSETDKISSDMKNTTAQLENLEKDVLRPQLKQLAEVNIITPIQLGQLTEDLDLMLDLKNALDKVQAILVKQGACQQMVSHLNDISLSTLNNNMMAIQSLVESVESQLLMKKPLIKDNTENSLHYITTIKNLLNEFLKDGDTKDKTPIEQIHALIQQEAQLKSKWQDDFQSCLDAAQELGAFQHRLRETLYIHSSSSDNLILTPKPYTSLQSELEFRTLEIKAALSELEKNTDNPDNKILFKQQKKLFALFFTDPISFEQLHSNIVNK